MRFLRRKPKPPLIEPDELARLRRIEQLAAKLARLLDDGQVDYDLVEELKGLLRG